MDPDQVMQLFRSFLQQQKEMMNELQKNRPQDNRVIPMVDKLKRQEDFPVWKDKVINSLRRHKLDKHILTDVPAPKADPELAQWQLDRMDVDNYLQQAVSDINVWNRLRGRGWTAT
jgi:hypothetical protein